MTASVRAAVEGVEERVLPSIADIPREKWNALVDEEASPFVDWRFLEALEHTGRASEETGWTPRHLTLWRGQSLVAAAPAYVRTDSDGDFSRDWGWAEGIERAGVSYYPKLAITVPFTPVTGSRVLAARGEERAPLVRRLVELAREVARQERCSSVQVLFPRESDVDELATLGMAKRLSHQFHWRNEGYRSIEEFLGRFSSKKRNQLKRERAAPAEQGIAIRTVRGDELASDPKQWAKTVHALHRSTVEKLMWGRSWLDRAFYERVFERMPERLEVVEARRNGRIVAGAFNVASAKRLYGRYWGCLEEHPFLHFNVCLYHSIDECIRRGTEAFEGGAGGDHKLVRGFEPAETFSAHWFVDPRIDAAIRRHIEGESATVAASLAKWRADSPILRHPR